MVLSVGPAAGCVRARSSSSPLRGGHCPPLAASTSRLEVWLRCSVHVGCGTPLFRRVVGCRRPARVREGHAEARRRVAGSALHRAWRGRQGEAEAAGGCTRCVSWSAEAGCQTQASDSPVLPPAPAASAGAARVWRLPGRPWDARPRRDRRTPLLSAAAGSVSPASPHSPPPIARCSAAPLRPSRAARRRDGCRGGDCVIVCVCIVCGATRAMRATRARGAST